MRLSDLSAARVRRAIELYLAQAYPLGSAPFSAPPVLQDGEPMDSVLARFERSPLEQVPEFARYTLRLGNASYPFMNFVLQEYLVAGEFFFSVDTHDDLDVRPSAPDYERWRQVKRENRRLKESIEHAWRVEGLPTLEDLRRLCEGLRGVEREEPKRRRLLVVDDERDVAHGLRALLEGRGYEVELAFSGEEVLERLGRDPLPDLVLLDYELPRLDGGEVLDQLRSDPRLADLPVLMATAASIDLARLRRVSGLLRKPYPRAMLFKMLRELLEHRAGAAP